MSEIIEELRAVYMALGEQCRYLEELKRSIDNPSQLAKVESARQKVANARIELWEVLTKEVIVEWCNRTDTPQLFHRYPPKDMPGNQKDECNG